jgi:hypothetical protein
MNLLYVILGMAVSRFIRNKFFADKPTIGAAVFIALPFLRIKQLAEYRSALDAAAALALFDVILPKLPQTMQRSLLVNEEQPALYVAEDSSYLYVNAIEEDTENNFIQMTKELNENKQQQQSTILELL